MNCINLFNESVPLIIPSTIKEKNVPHRVVNAAWTNVQGVIIKYSSRIILKNTTVKDTLTLVPLKTLPFTLDTYPVVCATL